MLYYLNKILKVLSEFLYKILFKKVMNEISIDEM